MDELNRFADDSYENVLREEFETMRKQYEKRLSDLQATLDSERKAGINEKVAMRSEVEKLKVQVSAMGARLLQTK